MQEEIIVYSRQEFARLIKCSESTLKNWAKKGLLVPNHKPSGRPFYTSEHYQQYLSMQGDSSPKHQ
jgi:DNA-binding transcriptional MerR regulator